MKIGIGIKNFSWPGGQETMGATIRDISQRSESVGFDSIWVMDHFFQIGVMASGDIPEQEPMMESIATLGFIAGVTERIRLGALVGGVTFRHPGLLIKAVTALDVVSGGRAYFGIGAAWNEDEHRGLGVPFPALSERFERLEETLQIAHQMWEGNQAAYTGKYYQLHRPINLPNSVQRPRPPILIGGSGEKKTLRLVAQYGDACNLFDMPDRSDVERKLDVLKRHCDDVGRPYEEIEKTIHMHYPGPQVESPTSFVARIQGVADLGFEHMMFVAPDMWNPETLDLLGREVVPAVHAM
jgi:F420-dependent oxidoreductase-like protein